MSSVAKRSDEGEIGSKVEDLEMMLDCAIAEGAQLRLPMFVWLLRLARLDLKSCTEGISEPKGDAPDIDG